MSATLPQNRLSRRWTTKPSSTPQARPGSWRRSRTTPRPAAPPASAPAPGLRCLRTRRRPGRSRVPVSTALLPVSRLRWWRSSHVGHVFTGRSRTQTLNGRRSRHIACGPKDRHSARGTFPKRFSAHAPSQCCSLEGRAFEKDWMTQSHPTVLETTSGGIARGSRHVSP